MHWNKCVYIKMQEMCLYFDKPRIYFYGSGLSREEQEEFSAAMEH